MNYTCHSEIGKIKSLFIKNVQQAFMSDSHLEQYWRSLNYLGKPDMIDARKEYKYFQSLIENHGAELFFFPEDPTVNMDSIYCRDASIATNKGMIICNMGKAARINEPMAEKKAFEKRRSRYWEPLQLRERWKVEMSPGSTSIRWLSVIRIVRMTKGSRS